MADEFGLDDILASVDKTINVAERSMATSPPSRELQLLQSVVARLKLARTDAGEQCPGLLSELKQSAERLRDEANRLPAEFDKSRAEVARVKAAAAETKSAASARLSAPPSVPTPPAPPPLDPGLGQTLRADLLARFAPGTDAAPPTAAPGKDIWEDWK